MNNYTIRFFPLIAPVQKYKKTFLTSDIEAIIAGELGERRHVVWVVGELMSLLRYTPRCLLDAVVI